MAKRSKTPVGNKGSRAVRGNAGRSSNSGFFRVRLLAFGAVVILVIGGAFALVRPTGGSADNQSTPVKVDMSGFAPAALTAKVGEPVKLRLINPDSEFHTDGGGKHQFAIAELGVNAIVNPKSEKAVTFTPTAPGTYTYYCDICCGGKENPSMVGTLTVTA